MMIAKPSPNPRSARAPYRQRISGGVLVGGKSVIGRSATGSCGSKSYRRTCLTSANGARQRLAARQLTGRLPMPGHPCRYHTNPEQATVSMPGRLVMGDPKSPLTCVLLPLPEHCTSGGVETRNVPYLLSPNGVPHVRERQKPQRPLLRYAEGHLLR